MTKKLKRLSKIGILLFGISILLWNCEKNDEIIQSTDNNNFSVRRINTQEIEQNSALTVQISEIRNVFNPTNNSNGLANRQNTTYDIDINEANYIEYGDGSYHSYTFAIENQSNNHNLENIILSLQDDGTYKAFLTTYTFTEEERLQFNNGEDINLSDRSTIEEIDYSDLNIANRSSVSCSYEKVEIDVEVACSIDGCWESQYTTWTTITVWGLVCTGGGGGSGNGNTGPSGLNTGGVFNPSNPFPNGINDSTITTPINPDGTSAVANILTNFLQPQLTTAQSRWINSHSNSAEVQALFDFLNDNQSSVDAQALVIKAIDFFLNFPTDDLNINDEDLLNEIIDALNDLSSFTDADYPGKDDGLPFEWWNDDDFILNSGNFDIDDEQPNAKEVALFAIFPSQAILHIENSVTALNKAEELVNNGTLTGIGDGKADAFRHAFWNALGTAEFGTEIMKLFADAHEWGETGLSVTMDFYNNHKGRVIGENYNFFTSEATVSAAILQAVFNGTLKYINSSGVLVPTNL